MDNLTLRGAGKGETVLAAVPRYANVLKFSDCRNLALEKLTAGHTTEPAFRFDECGDKTWNGAAIDGLNSMYDVDENGALIKFEIPREEESEYHGGVDVVPITPPTPQA